MVVIVRHISLNALEIAFTIFTVCLLSLICISHQRCDTKGAVGMGLNILKFTENVCTYINICMGIIHFIFIPLTKAFRLKTVDIEFAFIPIPGSKSSFVVVINMLWLFADECSQILQKYYPSVTNETTNQVR